MLSEPDMQVLTSMVRVRGHPDFERVLDWIRTQRADLSAECEQAEAEIKLRRCQGAAMALKEMIHWLDDAPVMVDKLRRK